MTLLLPLALAMSSTAASAHHGHHGAGVDAAPDVEGFVAIALEAHPSIEAQRRRVAALRQRVEPAGALMDPMFSVALENNPIDRFKFNATPMTGIQLRFSQQLPWPGKRDLRSEAVEHMAEAAGAGVDEQKNAIALAVRSAYYELHFTDVAISVARSNVGIIEDFVAIADAKYRVGKGLQQDPLKARVQRDQIQERLLALVRMRDKQRIRLNNLLARPETTAVPSLIAVPVREIDDGLSADALVRAARTSRPRLVALTKKIEAAGAKERLAHKDLFPDFTVGAGYRIRFPKVDPVDGANFWTLSLGVNLPVYASSKQDPLARAAHEDAAALREELAVALLEIRQVVEDELQQLPRYVEQMELYRTAIIPNTKQSLEADQIAYQVDRIDFLNLLDIEMRLFNFEVDYHRLHVAREQAIVRIAHAVGVPPDDLIRVATDAAEDTRP